MSMKCNWNLKIIIMKTPSSFNFSYYKRKTFLGLLFFLTCNWGFRSKAINISSLCISRWMGHTSLSPRLPILFPPHSPLKELWLDRGIRRHAVFINNWKNKIIFNQKNRLLVNKRISLYNRLRRTLPPK